MKAKLYLIGFLLVLVGIKYAYQYWQTQRIATAEQVYTPTQSQPTRSLPTERKPPASTRKSPTTQPNATKGVPQKVWEVLAYVKEHDEAPKGYVGGRTFQNRERRLPATTATGARIRYQEWDVNPRVQGKNRGAQRLVTGSDGSAYYTDDHYDTFIKIE